MANPRVNIQRVFARGRVVAQGTERRGGDARAGTPRPPAGTVAASAEARASRPLGTAGHGGGIGFIGNGREWWAHIAEPSGAFGRHRTSEGSAEVEFAHFPDNQK